MIGCDKETKIGSPENGMIVCDKETKIRSQENVCQRDLEQEQVVVKSSESERRSNCGDDQTVPGDRDEEHEEEKYCCDHL